MLDDGRQAPQTVMKTVPSSKQRAALSSAISLALFAASLFVMRRELRAVTWPELMADVSAVPPGRLLLALALTVANYGVIAGGDVLAFSYIDKPMSRVRVAAAALIAVGVSNNLGFGLLSGGSLRFRFFSRWGVGAEDLTRIVLFNATTFVLGLVTLTGLALVVTPLSVVHGPGANGVAAAGWLLLLVGLGYVLVVGWRRRTIRLWKVRLPMPEPKLAASQIALSSFDWMLAVLVLYVLLPPGAVPFTAFFGAFLSAHLLGQASHVPSGLGVFDSLLLLLLKPYVEPAALIPRLVAYRAVYYLVPLVVALLGLLVDELRLRYRQVARR
jgi:phosphatidylglycerol lysyltransferase